MATACGELMGFAENLKRLRAEKGWTQAEAARRASAPFRSYQNWEAGTREPRLDALVKLAAAFGVATDDLLEGVGAAPTDVEPEPDTGGATESTVKRRRPKK